MNVTTSRAFRKKHLGYFVEEDFENSWDYFIYLHVNPHVQRLHIGGTLIGLSLFPWAMYRFFFHFEIWPTFIFTFFYYGFGFLSHWTGDGQISGTWKQIFLTYAQAVKMNVRIVKGIFKKDVAAFFIKYPHTKWLYFSEFSPPADINEQSRPTSSGSSPKKSGQTGGIFTS